MGTPEFAVGILDIIIKNNYTVVGSLLPIPGRTKIKIFCSKRICVINNLRLLQPTNLKEEFLN
jgi:methionyl-tRNA formyltransferase